MAIDYQGRDFNDPIVRCEQCAKITHRAYIKKYAGCVNCGNKRFKNVRGLEEDEYYGLKNGTLKIGLDIPYKIDPNFLKQFEEAEDIKDE